MKKIPFSIGEGLFQQVQTNTATENYGANMYMNVVLKNYAEQIFRLKLDYKHLPTLRTLCSPDLDLPHRR